MNYKKLAVSASLIAAVAYPKWTGSWSAYPLSVEEFSYARMAVAENSYLLKNKTTRAEFMRVRYKKCDLLSKNWKPKSSDEQFLISPEDERAGNLDACHYAAIVSDPDETFESYLAGLRAGAQALVPLIADTLIGAVAAGLLAFFGPRAILRYYRWLQAE